MTQIRVRDLMTTHVITLRPTDTVKQAVIRMAIDNVSSTPVVDNRRHVVGFLSQTDVLKLIMRYQNRLDKETMNAHMLSTHMDDDSASDVINKYNSEISETKVGDIMIKTVVCTTPDAYIVEAMRAMLKTDINMIPVIEQGVLLGTVSRSDVLFYIYKRKV